MASDDRLPELPSEAEIRARIAAARERAARGGAPEAEPALEVPEVRAERIDDTEFQAKLAELEQKADRIRGAREAQKKDMAAAQRQEQSSARGLGVGLQLAYVLLGLPLAGAAAGFAIDQWRGTTMWKGVLCLGGAVLAIAWIALQVQRDDR
jgi:F0F1-type ATP synthase assembly protein I